MSLLLGIVLGPAMIGAVIFMAETDSPGEDFHPTKSGLRFLLALGLIWVASVSVAFLILYHLGSAYIDYDRRAHLALKAVDVKDYPLAASLLEDHIATLMYPKNREFQVTDAYLSDVEGYVQRLRAMGPASVYISDVEGYVQRPQAQGPGAPASEWAQLRDDLHAFEINSIRFWRGLSHWTTVLWQLIGAWWVVWLLWLASHYKWFQSTPRLRRGASHGALL